MIMKSGMAYKLHVVFMQLFLSLFFFCNQSLHGDRASPGQDIWWPEWASNLGSSAGHRPTTPHHRHYRNRDGRDTDMTNAKPLTNHINYDNATHKPLTQPEDHAYLSTPNTSPMSCGLSGASYVYPDFSVDPCSIFIGNLFDNATEKAVHQRFSTYGDILDLHVVRKTLERSYKRKRVFAFVQYAQESSAARAIECEVKCYTKHTHGLRTHSLDIA